MGAGRYASTDLELIADEIRDQAITLHAEMIHNKPHFESEVTMLSAQISASVALADFLRRDAARLRRLEISNASVE